MTTEQIKVEKKCNKCGEVKELALFAACKKCKNGKANYCKECAYKKNKEYRLKNRESARDYAKEYRIKNPDKTKEYLKKYRESAKGREGLKKYNAKFREEYPEKYECLTLWNVFRLKNEIISPPDYEFHHFSYKKENHNSVILLPIWFHKIVHKNMAYAQEEKCFRAADGVLLDTKIKHLEFIQYIKRKSA